MFKPLGDRTVIQINNWWLQILGKVG